MSSRLVNATQALSNARCLASPSVSTVLKRTPNDFVLSDLHRITVARLYSMLHTHSGPHRLWSVHPACNFLASRIAVSREPLCSIPYTDFGEFPFHALG